MENIRVVALDFDDTLCLTEQACFKLENYVASQLGLPYQSKEIHLKTWGQPVEQASALRFPGINTKEFKALLDKELLPFIANGELDQITSENYDVLKQLKASGKSLVIVTSRSEAEVRHLVDPSHPLSLHIDAFYHGGNSDFLKPDPRVFEAMLKQFNCSPNEAVYVGDSISDAKSAKDAGLLFVASLESGLRSKEDFQGIRVDYFIENFSELLDITH